MIEELLKTWTIAAFPLFVYHYMRLEGCKMTDEWLEDKSITVQISIGMFDMLVAFLVAYAITAPFVIIHQLVLYVR